MRYDNGTYFWIKFWRLVKLLVLAFILGIVFARGWVRVELKLHPQVHKIREDLHLILEEIRGSSKSENVPSTLEKV